MIFPMRMPEVTFEIEGLTASFTTAVTEALNDIGGETVAIEVVAGGTRGAAQNALIAKAQANHNRNPFYLNDSAFRDAKDLATAMFSVARESRDAIAKRIGDVMLASIQSNVDAQRNPEGESFKPLSLSYARRKQRQFGFVIPILRATGDLMKGLKSRITKT